MKQKTLIFTSILIGLTITGCNQITNQSSIQTSTDTSAQIHEDTFVLVNRIDIEKFKKSGFQIFENENFIIKNKHTFELEKSFEGDKSTFPYTTYVAYKNKGDFENGAIFRIKVDNIEADYKNIERKDYPENTKSFMDNYKRNLSEYNIDFSSTKVDGDESLIYKMTQQDPNSGMTIKTTAAFFVHERKSYLIQITSSKDQDQALQAILKIFKFIK